MEQTRAEKRVATMRKKTIEAEENSNQEKQAFKDRFKYLRVKNGYSQKELANAIDGISFSSLAHYESGRRYPTRKVQKKLADFFGVDIDYLMGRTDVKDRHQLESKAASSEYTENEMDFLTKYRRADDYTKRIVELILMRARQED